MSANELVFRPSGARTPEQPAYSEDGVDLTLIRWMLSLTPSGRLRQLQGFLHAAERTWERNGTCPDPRISKRS